MPPFSKRALASAGKRLGVQLIVLFGSWATGRPVPGPDSDIDIAVLDAKPASPRRFELLRRALCPIFDPHELDLALLSQADTLFRYEILSRGRLLYGDILELLEYKAYAYRDYVDSEDLLRLENTLLIKKLGYIERELHA